MSALTFSSVRGTATATYLPAYRDEDLLLVDLERPRSRALKSVADFLCEQSFDLPRPETFEERFLIISLLVLSCLVFDNKVGLK
jgi:hypothetical protein